MKHLFVPYELALMAKEKGFNEPCFSLYFSDGEFNNASANYFNHNSLSPRISAPLYQQLVDWFRDEHELYICVGIFSENKDFLLEIRNGSAAELVSLVSGDGYYLTLNKALEEAFKLI